ncbi:RRAGD [Cordylochernes scorpioides]|uniref:RRAGD n=1 Tax=Cordylochernes scorpioides TaxID=51811 RepID=A0ABY6KI03_9ARAC|nr:RRAGD [Cordylochernes scorpioides]
MDSPSTHRPIRGVKRSWHAGAELVTQLCQVDKKKASRGLAQDDLRELLAAEEEEAQPYVMGSFPKDFGYGHDERPDFQSQLPHEEKIKPRILLMGLRRSGKSSIQKVVFHKMSPNETLFLGSTSQIMKDDISNSSFVQFQIWDFPGQIDFFDVTFDSENIFGQCGALVFVIDGQDDYEEALDKLYATVSRAFKVNPEIRFEVFIHKVDGLTEENKMETQRDIQHRVREELLVDSECGEGLNLSFYLTSIYDHSIFEAFSKVVQKLIPQLPALENLLNIFISEVHGDHALRKSQCYKWFKKFQSGDFELDNEPRGKPHQKFEDAEQQALLDEDSTQTQEKLAKQLQVSQGAVSLRLNSLRMTQKLSRWVPHELSERQQERRLVTCEGLLARHEKKSFLHRIVTSDEKSIHFSNPMRQKSWGLLGQFPKQKPRPNRLGKKAMLCLWWDQTGVVYFKLLKPGETNSVIEKAFLFDVVSKIYIATDSSPVDMQSYELCCDMIDVVIDISCIYGLPEEGGGETSPFDCQSASVIKLNNSTVLYLREVNQFLALVCILREDNFERRGLIDYNFHCFRDAIREVLEVRYNTVVGESSVVPTNGYPEIN